MESCDAAHPYTLIGVLLRPPTSAHAGAAACRGRFFRDYTSRATNALLWIALISVTSLLFRRLARLVRLWVQGSRIPGPPSNPFLARSKLIAGCGSLGSLTGYLAELHETYGPIVRLWLSPTQLLVSVKDTMLIKEMLIKAEDKLPLTGRAFHLAFGRSSLFVSSFDKVRKRRESLAEYMNGKLAVGANNIPLKVVECVMGRVDTIMGKENKGNEKKTRLDAPVLLDNATSGGLFQEEMEEYLISKEEPCGNILGLMFHGCLATASLISSILTRLVLHPELQEKLYSEIIEVREKTYKLDSDDVQKMNLLMATVHESARLLPAGPLLQRCSLKHDICLSSGVTAPAGAILVVPLQLVQMDNAIWGKDASQFNPCRFFSEATNHKGKEYEDFGGSPFFSEPKKKAAFLPFGYGTRACVGEKFATLGIATLIASLLQNYEIRFQPGLDNDPKPIMNDCILQLLPSPKVVFVKRSK
ncbi:hypothetical protein C4D60_Mb03t08880 [Musa balbisiana]|uniref:Uncharacterized protein n=1 Tax=Musa balbisiana TaxID=52838 RepID=A0A4S8J8J7_MUSBA|nr:hypothetical protein C4D60_Mb03t08880 [Musa balbisiana]